MKIYSNKSLDFYVKNIFFQKSYLIDLYIKILEESFILNPNKSWIFNFRKSFSRKEITSILFPAISTYLNDLGYKHFAVKGFGAFPFIGLCQYDMDSFLYVRDMQKDYGLRSQVEGYAPKDKSLVVIEDLINTGQNAKKIKFILNKNLYDVSLIFCFLHFSWTSPTFFEAGFESIIQAKHKN